MGGGGVRCARCDWGEGTPCTLGFSASYTQSNIARLVVTFVVTLTSKAHHSAHRQCVLQDARVSLNMARPWNLIRTNASLGVRV